MSGMIMFIISIFLVIGAAIWVTTKTYHWLCGEYNKDAFHQRSPIYNRETYNVHEMYDTISYSDELPRWFTDYKNPFKNYKPDFIERLTCDKARQIGEKLLKEGFFEIWENKNHLGENPFANRIHMKLRVLKK